MVTSSVSTPKVTFAASSQGTPPPRLPSRQGSIASSIDGDDVDEVKENWNHSSKEIPPGACYWLVVPENNLVRNIWNILLAILLVYTGTVFPYRLCFVELSISGQAETNVGWTTVEWIVDGLFYIDLIANFFFSFRDNDGTEVRNLKRTSLRYLKGYFALNAIACIPPPLVGLIVEELFTTNDNVSVNKSTRLPRLQRISRLARLTRLTRLGKLFSFVMENPVWKWFQSLRGVRVINLVFGLCWAVHLVACGWYLTASLHSESDQEYTWVASRGLLEAGPVEQWFHANYFVLTVFTTVGFGDMSATTMGEIVYVCFTMVIGAVVHSIIMSEVINVVMSVDQSALELNSQKELVMGFARHADLQGPVMKDLLNFFERHRSKRQQFDRERMRQLITTCSMPRELVGDLIRGAFNGRLENNQLITTCLRYEKRMPPRFPLLVALALSGRRFYARELVYSAYDAPWNLFLVTSGTFAHIAFPSRQGGMIEMPPECIDLTRTPQPSSSHLVDYAMATKRNLSVSGIAFSSVMSRRLSKTATSSRITEEKEKKRHMRSTLFPYQLFGVGTYFGEAELLLEPGRSRFSSCRCETEDPGGGSVLQLHVSDLMKLCNEFPRFATAWRAASCRREERRKKLLQRLRHGHHYRGFAAMTIQRYVRSLLLRTGDTQTPVHAETPGDRQAEMQPLGTTTWYKHSMFSGESNQVTLTHLNALRTDMLKAIHGIRQDVNRALYRDRADAGLPPVDPTSPSSAGLDYNMYFESPRAQQQGTQRGDLLRASTSSSVDSSRTGEPGRQARPDSLDIPRSQSTNTIQESICEQEESLSRRVSRGENAELAPKDNIVNSPGESLASADDLPRNTEHRRDKLIYSL